MVSFDQIGAQSDIARVRLKSLDGRRLFLEFRNGRVGTVDGEKPFDISVGSVVLIRPDDNYFEVAPDDLWPEESWVGVVRLKLEDTTIVDSRGIWKMIPTRDDIEYFVGNTVEGRDLFGVVRVLSEEPIKYLDLPAVDDSVIAKFKLQKDTKKETFEDFGGFESVVARARELIEVPLKKKDALSKIGTRPIKGVLFTGPPGTGKTMLARIIANSTDSEFYEISGPEIFSKWYGQSEEILRKIFEDARNQKQAIIFFDEIDSVAGQRDDDSHEASRRVVAQLLTLMDGFTSDDNIIVIATSNRPQDIDAALRRPGRFDWEINFPFPNDRDRKLILEASARALRIKGDLPHLWVSKNTNGWSPADLAAIWTEAALLAVADDRSEIIAEDYFGGYERVSDQKIKIENAFIKGEAK